MRFHQCHYIATFLMYVPTSSWRLLMAWCPIGTRPSAIIMLNRPWVWCQMKHNRHHAQTVQERWETCESFVINGFIFLWWYCHYSDVIIIAIASQITSVSIVCWTVGSGTDQRKHQSAASLAFVRGIHQWPVNFPHQRPVARKMFPFDDIIKPPYSQNKAVPVSCNKLTYFL